MEGRTKTIVFVLLAVFFVLAFFIGVWIYKIYNNTTSFSQTSSDSSINCVGYGFSVTDSRYESARLSVGVKNSDYSEFEITQLVAQSGNISVTSGAAILPGEATTVIFDGINIYNDSFTIYVKGCSKNKHLCKVGEICG